jgi:site-specific DNA recombinase
VRTDLLELAVWQEVRALLENPHRLEQEFQRRQQEPTSNQQQKLETLKTQRQKLRNGMGRLIDSYAEGFIEKSEFEPRIQQLRERITGLETQLNQASEALQMQQELRLILARLEELSTRIKQGLDQLDWDSQRELIRTVVKRVEINQDQVHVVFRVDAISPPSTPDKDFLQHCTGRDLRRSRPPRQPARDSLQNASHPRQLIRHSSPEC